MGIEAEKHRKAIIVCIFDPLPLDKVRVDQIRQENLFEVVASLEGNAIFLASPSKNIEISVQLTRLEYIDANDAPFDKRNIEIYEKALKVLPPLRIKAMGVNLNYALTLEGNIIAAEYIRDKFLKENEALQDKIGSPIIGSSTRIFYGEPTDHFDIRIYPLDLISKEIGITIHKHKDKDIANQDLLIKETHETFYKSCEEYFKLKNKLF